MNRRATIKRLFSKVVAVVLLLFLGAGIAGCGGKKPPKSSSKEQIVPKTASLKEKGEDFPQTPQSRIQQDLLAGKITEEQAVILGLKAVFAPSDLPKEYEVEYLFEVKPSVNAELQWITDNLDKITPTAREKLEPFILPPRDPKSFFHPKSVSRDQLSRLSFISTKPAYAAEEDLGTWEVVVCEVPGGAGKSVHIYYHLPPGIPDAEKGKRYRRAQEVKEAIETAWPKYKELLQVEPEQSFDVHITDLRQDATWGLAWWNAQSKRCEMSIHDGLDGEKLKSTVAHELFHCFQLYIPHRFYLKEPDKIWLFEATATWAEHYTYPRLNVEHRWLDYFFSTLYRKRIVFNGGHEYASYPLFFFASDFLNDKDYVRRVLVAAKTANIPSAMMDSMSDFGDKYGKFAVYSWNRDPFLLYNDPPKFPAIGAKGDSASEVDINNPNSEYFDERLRPGAISYWHLKFNPDKKKVEKVVFNLMADIANPYFKRQALVKIGGNWVVEDWTGIKERSFCRERPGQEIEEAVVIFSNGDFRTTLTFAFQVDATQKCPRVLTGYTRITEKHQGDGLQSEIHYQASEEIEYDPVQKAYVVKSMTANYSMNQTVEGQMVLGVQGTTVGSGSLQETYGQGEQPVKILEKPGETILILETKTAEEKWVSYRQTSSVEYAGTETDSWQGGPTGFWPKNITLNREEVGSDRIKGRRVTQTAPGFGTAGELVIEFEYELK